MRIILGLHVYNLQYNFSQHDKYKMKLEIVDGIAEVRKIICIQRVPTKIKVLTLTKAVDCRN